MNINKDTYLTFRHQIFEVMDAQMIASLDKESLRVQISNAVNALADSHSRPVTTTVRAHIVKGLFDEITGLGPIQPLIDDDTITDIMVNGPNQIYFERKGKIHKSDITFVSEQQLLEIAKRIANRVGRRVDESSPLVDARLDDGSRVNIIIPPVALDGSSISIRKFRKQSILLEDLVNYGSISYELAKVLIVAARCRLNILISGGTGSGKTTLLNVMSNYIAEDERIITIEDAAELQLQQPHVIRLETRAASIENTGKISQRDLIINSLRMRPDRVILGEVRGEEAFEMLQAMNTGHDGSMSTLHANTPRDAIARVESMVMMAGLNQPIEAIRRNIVSAVHLIVQVNRLRDGSRKVTSLSEVVGLEGQNVVIEEIFSFQYTDDHYDAEQVHGEFITNGIMQRSELVKRARYFGLYDELMSAFRGH